MSGVAHCIAALPLLDQCAPVCRCNNSLHKPQRQPGLPLPGPMAVPALLTSPPVLCMATTATISSSLGVHPLRFMALKNICSEGYTHTCRQAGGRAGRAGERGSLELAASR
jgi:hypothetical protein